MPPPIDSIAISPSEERTVSSEAFAGSNHPLSKDGFDGAVKLGEGDKTTPLEGKLNTGDHIVQLKDGRQFQIHIPAAAIDAKSLPVMFVIAGSAQPQWDIKDFAKESGMNQFAEDPKHSFIAVYPLPLKHNLGKYSVQAAFGWNAEGSLIDKENVKFAGYDDMTFVKSVANLLPRIANVDSSRKNWGAIAWSQGGPFLNALISKEANLFPSVGLVGSTMQTDYRYAMRPGNAKNVAIINLLDDKVTLPISGNLSYLRREIIGQLLRGVGRKDVIERANPLGAINNIKQDPALQEQFYAQNIFPKNTVHHENSYNLSTPIQNRTKDYVKEYRSTTYSGAPLQLTVFSLVDAKHSYPGPLRGARTNAQEKYTEFDASGEFVKLFNSYNDRLDADKKN